MNNIGSFGGQMNFKLLFLLFFIIGFYSCTDEECKYDTQCEKDEICSINKCIKVDKECNSNDDCIGSEKCEENKYCSCQVGKCTTIDPCLLDLCKKDSKCLNISESPYYSCKPNDPCKDDRCGDNSLCSEKSESPYYSCKCKDGYHESKEGKSCISNTRSEKCVEDNPENSKSIVEIVEIKWDREKERWNEVPKCSWNCNEKFHTEDNISCISNSKIVKCVDKSPSNATSDIKDVEIIWSDETKSWSEIKCDWSCDEGYIQQDNICVIKNWSHISRGFDHTCGIYNGFLYCWGSNNRGQLGLGDDYGTLANCDQSSKLCTTPQKVGKDYHWKMVATGVRHTCAIKTTGELFCWGSNDSGELGLGTSISFNLPKKVRSVSGKWIYIATSGSTSSFMGESCGIIKIADSNQLYCWGRNGAYQLGLGDRIVRYEPIQVGSGNNWLTVTTGGKHTCGIRNDGIYGWGSNYIGQLGLGDNAPTEEKIPKVIDNKAGWKMISAGENFTCAIDSDSKLYCWGINYTGQLGLGDSGNYANKSSPRLVSSTITWNYIIAGTSHSCGIDSDDFLYCWGNNDNYQLGQDDTTLRKVPIKVKEEEKWKQVIAGEAYSCAITLVGDLYCWGNNHKGQLGVGDKNKRHIPEKVIIR